MNPLSDTPGFYEIRNGDDFVLVRAKSPRAALDKWTKRYRRTLADFRLVRDPTGPLAQADLPRPKHAGFWESPAYPMDLFVFVFAVKGIR